MADPAVISVFRNAACEARYLSLYADALAHWPVPCEERDIPTRLGLAHAIISGPGDGFPALLLPGNLDSSLEWRSTTQVLSRSHRVYALDVIGDIGRSQAYRLLASRSDHMSWLADVLDVLDLKSLDLLGISHGGYLAASFALKFPPRVRRLVLLAPGLPLAPPTLQWMLRGMPMILFPTRGTATWFVRGASVSREQNEAFVTGLGGARSTDVLRPSMDADELRELAMPVLLLIGEREIMYRAEQAVARARQLIPHLQAEIVPAASHFLTSDQPQIVGGLISRFLDETNAGI